VDLKTRGVAPTSAELAAVQSVLGAAPPPRTHDGLGRRRERRHLLLPTLHALNDRVGWISQEAIDHVAERLDVSPAEIYGVVTFYGLFSTEPRTQRQLHVCVDLACRAHPSFDEAAIPAGAHAAPCLGWCARAPAAMVVDPGDPPTRVVHGELTPAALAALAAGRSLPAAVPDEVPQAGDPDLVLLRRAGRPDPLDVDAYLADGGLDALQRARELGPAGIIEAIDAAGLVGRGGAAFPTARKWEAVRRRPEVPHHLVCNADESEPGTFKDRVLIEHDPFALLESMCIAAIATGSEHGWIYVRGEYPQVESSLSAACDAFRSIGVLGNGFDITIVRGAGAYICGEETALFNSIEGFRGEPRNKPPFPFESGLFGRPTVVNNVETLMNVPSIVLGRTSSSRRLFCVSGAVAVPGVYEVELGLTLGDLIDLAGGLRPGSELAAVLLGGAAGRFVGPDAIDLILDHDSVRAAGLTLGSGAVIVHDQHVDLVDQVRRIAAFFREESCGQCVPCRVGTVRQQEALDRLAAGGDRDVEAALLDEIGRAMTDASICGLGQTASHAVESAVVTLDLFRTRGPGAAP
jgi:NADH-quinone oxidoreductase subunit F